MEKLDEEPHGVPRRAKENRRILQDNHHQLIPRLLSSQETVVVGKSISPKIPLLLFFFSNVSLVLLLAKVCKPTRCSSTGYQYSELLFFSCLFSGQLKLHNGVLGAGIIDYIPATFTNSDTPSTNNAFLLKATFCYSSRILALFSTLLSY